MKSRQGGNSLLTRLLQEQVERTGPGIQTGRALVQFRMCPSAAARREPPLRNDDSFSGGASAGAAAWNRPQ